MKNSRWKCPSCGSTAVQISLPTWFWEDKDCGLTMVETDTEADPLYWYCEGCDESGAGDPDINDQTEEPAEDLCLRCGQNLSTDEGRKTGICPDCWKEEDEDPYDDPVKSDRQALAREHNALVKS